MIDQDGRGLLVGDFEHASSPLGSSRAVGRARRLASHDRHFLRMLTGLEATEKRAIVYTSAMQSEARARRKTEESLQEKTGNVIFGDDDMKCVHMFVDIYIHD